MPDHPLPTDAPTECLNLAALAATPLAHVPFDHLVVPGFLSPEIARKARLAFPEIQAGGLIPAGPGGGGDLGRIVVALRSSVASRAFGDKFGVALDPSTLMITLRGHCRATDGGIHADSKSKLITCLLYLNDGWTAEGGRLRLLRGPTDMEDMAAEIPPLDGMLVAFRRTDRSFHGHKPFEGVRRAIMFNWMVDAAAARREELRHGFSQGFKRIAALLG